jgi:non-specific serine/threonine protein kinase/serine/threonine-protein kinase
MPPAEPTVMPDHSPPPSDNVIGHFQLGAEIGVGGMGVVYLARDVDLDRDVAVKTLNERHGADAAASQRFLVEAKITGQLAHPGIPAVHELGTLSDGRPFLAMKLVKGQTLRALLQERSDAGQERGRFIAIFEQICQALGYAHAHRVIHRDLKPDNVMVGAHGEVQVMDWGLAKLLREQDDATQADEEDPWRTHAYGSVIDTLESDGSKTQTGQMLGTPAYMPPEQAGGQVRLLDPRSDVFGLGAILCDILTGQPPYGGKTANEVRLQAVRGDLADALARLDHGDAEPELTALCKRCLAFKQEDRPPDGAAVAAEVGRIRQAAEDRARQAELERERVLVRALEQRKRRRVVQLAGGLIAVVLLVGLAVSSWQMVRAKRERDDKQTALDAEAAAKQDAERRLAQFEKGVELVAGMLKGIDPRAEEKGEQPLYEQLREHAEKVADQLQAEAVGDSLAEARLQTILGNTLVELGSYARAVEVLQRARATREERLGADHPETLNTLATLALAYQAAGKLPQAIALHQQVRDGCVRKRGADHPSTLNALGNLASAYRNAGKLPEAIALYQQVREALVKKLGAGHPDTLNILNNLALTYQAVGKVPEAIALFQQIREARVKKQGADHPDTLGTLSNLASAYFATGHLPEAIEIFEQVRDARVKKMGADHPSTLGTLNNLAVAYQNAGRLPEAIALLQQVRDGRVKKLGADHPDTLNTLNNLASAYYAAGKLPEAIALFQQVREAEVKKLGADHPETLTTLNNLAVAYQAAGKLPEAIALLRQVHDASVKKLGADHPKTLMPLHSIAVAYRKAGKLAEAIELHRQVRDACVKKLGLAHPVTLAALAGLALAYDAAGRLPEALPLFEQAAAGLRKQRFLHPLVGTIIPKTISAHEAAKAWDRAERWRRAWMEHVREKDGAESPAYASELAGLGLNLLRQRRWTEAESVLDDALKLQRTQAPEAWTTFNTMSLLGAALAGHNKHAEAEPLLLKGYQGMKVRLKSMPPESKVRLPESAHRLVELYRAMKKDDEARKWQQTLANIVGKLQGPIHDVGKGLTLKNQLDSATKTLAYQVRLQAGTQYVIAMSSADAKALAPSVVLTDENNNVLAEAGNPCGKPGARITYRVLQTAVYRIRATSANEGQGAFTLRVAQKKE